MKKNWPILLGLIIFILAMLFVITKSRENNTEIPLPPLLDNIFDIPSTTNKSYNPTECEFQPPLVSREPSLTGINYIVARSGPGWVNYTWDNTFPGLHRTNLSGWPGLDFLYPTTIAFKNGGIVDKAGYDNGGGGGQSLYIKGIGVCEGWYIYIGHLNYDPTTRYSPGDFIEPAEVIGEPGCSGFEDSCWKGERNKAPQGLSWAHNHYALGYKENIFSFDDGTEIVYQAGYYWINLARMEDLETNLKIIDNPLFLFPPDDTPTP